MKDRNEAAKVDDRKELAEACQALLRQPRGRAGGSQDYEDIAQDACVRMLRIEEPEAVRDPLRYVFRVSRNLLIDRQRHRRREAALFGTADDIERRAQDFIDPERTFAGKQELERALAAIEALPPRCRQAFKLHRFDGLSYAAIARVMAISTSMVEKHIAEALLKLNRSLRELSEPTA